MSERPGVIRAVLERALLAHRAVAWQRIEPYSTPGGAWRELLGLDGAAAPRSLLDLIGLREVDLEPGHCLPWVRVGERHVDVHFEESDGRWVVLIDRSDEAQREWAVQQHANELALARGELARAHARLEAAFTQMDVELRAAAEHVRAMLPPPGRAAPGVDADWRFVPSARLGGDIFGYGPLGGGRWRVYIVDVCGHGVAAALLAVSVRNAIESNALPGALAHDPASVMAALEAAFPMEAQGDRFFTAWYGVWDASQRELAFACAGHHPALLVDGARPGHAGALLEGPGGPIGMGLGSRFETSRAACVPGARLWLCSDAAFEARQPDGAILGFDRLVAELALPERQIGDLDDVWARISALTGAAQPDDDYSLLRVTFA